MKRTDIFALNVSLNFFETFSSEDALIAACPGLAIAEGDWLFFAADGSPLEAHFSKPAYIDTDRCVYGDGTYVLRSGSGRTLPEVLGEMCAAQGTVWFGSLESLEARFK